MLILNIKRCLSATICLVLFISPVSAQSVKQYTVTSPNGKTTVKLETGPQLRWSVKHNNADILLPSAIAVTLQTREVLGQNARVASAKDIRINQTITSPFYKKAIVNDDCNQLNILFKGNYGIIVRAYNDGVAYRFYTKRTDSLIVVSEQCNLQYPADRQAYVPYVTSARLDKFEHSYENAYRHLNLSKITPDSLVYLPFMVAGTDNVKTVFTEADLEDYPAIYLRKDTQGSFGFKTESPTYPTSEQQGGYNMTQSRVKERAEYIARVAGTRNFPWRVMAISNQDKDLLNNDLVYKLTEPNRLTDISWIKPGKVAWDWWNDWNLSHVDFKAGINTETYKYYIDFAAKHNIVYVLLDEGWAVKGDIMKIVPEIDLQQIINYGKSKNVGIWLWGGMFPVNVRMEECFKRYAGMGIKGFKIDFINRDDQQMMRFYYRAAKLAAENRLMLDFHGACKPTGLLRTYPNVLNYEGVYGLEMAKFPTKVNFPEHAVSIPFIRMLAGPMDYTPGAMRNAAKGQFYPSLSSPMSQGTRCHQLAMYVVFESPFEMLADSPTNYEREAECTDFITSVPTVFDETVAITGELGKYAGIARRKDDTWYVGILNNWDARDLKINLPFLKGNFKATIFQDGINAGKAAEDYKRVQQPVKAGEELNVHLAPGGGWVAVLTKQ